MVRRISMLLLITLILAACNPYNPDDGTTDWCYKFKFTQGDYGVNLVSGTRLDGFGLTTNASGALSFSFSNVVSVQPNIVLIDAARGQGVLGDIQVTANAIVFGVAGNFSGGIPFESLEIPLVPESSTDLGTTMNVTIQASQTIHIRSITIGGNYVNPFGGDNCLDVTNTPAIGSSPSPIPTNTPNLTATSTPFLTDTPNPTATPPTNTATATRTTSPTPTPNNVVLCENFDNRHELDFTTTTYRGLTSVSSTTGLTGNGLLNTSEYIPTFNNYESWVTVNISTHPQWTINYLTIDFKRVANQFGGGSISYSYTQNGNSVSLPDRSVNDGGYFFTSYHPASQQAWSTDGVSRLSMGFRNINSGSNTAIHLDNICLHVRLNGYLPTPTPTATPLFFTPTFTPTLTQRPPTLTRTPTRTRIGIGVPTQTPLRINTLLPTIANTSTRILPTATRTLIPPPTSVRSNTALPTSTTGVGTATLTPNATETYIASFTTTPSGTGTPAIQNDDEGVISAVESLDDGINGILDSIGQFFNWLTNLFLNFFDWLGSFIGWLFGSIGNFFTLLGNFFAGIGALFGLILKFFAEIASLVGVIISFALNFVYLIGTYVAQFIGVVTGIVNAWVFSPVVPIPYMPLCASQPLNSQLCAMYFIFANTLFSGGVGRLIMPVVTIVIDLFIVLYFIKTVRNLIRQAEGVTN